MKAGISFPFYICMYGPEEVGGMVQWAKVIATKPDDLIPGTPMVKENQSLPTSCLLASTYVLCRHACMQTHIRYVNKCNLKDVT